MKNSEDIRGVIIVSTCNRVELYADVLSKNRGIRLLKEFISIYHNQNVFEVEKYFYSYTNKQAILHLFKVSAGIDSQIIGEKQILGQLQFSYNEAEQAGTVTNFLNVIFNEGIDIGVKIRDNTAISTGNFSLANAAVSIIKNISGGIKNKEILIIGVGKISELVVKELNKEKAAVTFVSNRSYEKACKLADCVGAKAVRFNQLEEKLNEVDVIISATSSPHLMIKREDLENVRNELLIIDFSVPRDIEEEVKYLKGVTLFCLDDIDSIIEKDLIKRKQEIPKALRIIEKRLEDLCLNKYFESAFEPVFLP